MKEQKKKGNLLFLIIKIVFLFLITDLVISRFPGLMTRAVNTGKFGLSFIVEMFAVLVVFIVMMLSKNQYVFTDKKENFFKSILLGLPILLIALLVGVVNIPAMFEPSFNLSNLLTLIMFCISIGLYEEFLCRGWILNEFLEQYGQTRKQVMVSIFLSSLIFGLMHISNIWIGGQSVSETINQIIQATAIGVLLGSVYFRSKNIWSVVFLHGFYDFCIFLGSVNTLKDCHYVNETMTISQLIASFTFCAIYILTAAFILRRNKISHLVEKEPDMTNQEKTKSDRKIIFIVIAIVAFLQFPIPSIEEEENSSELICYDYKEKKLADIEYHYPSYATYQFIDEEIIRETITTVDPIDPNIIINNEIEKKIEHKISFIADNNKLTIIIDKHKSNIDFTHPINLIVLEQNDSYLLFIHEQNQTSGESTIHYSNYLQKGKIKNNQEYINELAKSIEKKLVPDVSKIGYITTRQNKYKYPMLYVGTNNYLYLDENNEIFILKN